MGNISSFNMEQSKDFNVYHNADARPNYAIGGKIEYTLNGYEATKLKNEIIQNAKEAYKRYTGQKFQAKSFEWSAVVNLKPESTMQDLEKLVKHFSDKYGFQCYQIAIHRDEGHIDELGEKHINHHAHLEFITLDKETGKNRQREIKPNVLRQIQSEVAEILQMERGQDKRLTGAKRIKPRIYAQMKEQEKKAISLYKKENLKLRQKNQELGKAYLNEKNDNYNTSIENEALKYYLNSEKQKNDELYQKINEMDSRHNSELLNAQNEIDKLNEENQDLNFALENAKNELILTENYKTNIITSKKYGIDLSDDFADVLLDCQLSPVISSYEGVIDEKRLPNERLNDLNDFEKRQDKLFKFSPQLHQIILDKYFKGSFINLLEWCNGMRQKLETLVNKVTKRVFGR